MSRQLFGTDGIRGVAGEFPLDSPTAFALGAALGAWAAHRSATPEVVIGMDTRESGPWLASAVAGGLAHRGVRPRFAGLITTPGIAYLTRTGSFVAGVMISASHNPYQDNGLKVFDHSGFKLPDDQEREIEREIFALLNSGVRTEPEPLTVDEGLDARYIDYLASTMPASLAGKSLVIDCANGAASNLARELFERVGAQVHAIGCSPNGRNINLDSGALHLEGLRREVQARAADAGLAFDGDADRCMIVSPTGKTVDGDAVLLLAAAELQDQGRLNSKDGKSVVVATVMSNLGLERALNARGIELVRTAVGDKYVLEEMERRGVALGGEQSGHVIFREYATTGDGLLTALRVLEVVQRSGKDLDELTKDLKIYPQTLVNVKVKARRPLEDMATVQQEIQRAQNTFGNLGRVFVRFSGTEPLARVMVEGPDQGQVEQFAHAIAGAIRAELGA
jgi:phosphoglucosamine mutase